MGINFARSTEEEDISHETEITADGRKGIEGCNGFE
jgi:hypothetical protein